MQRLPADYYASPVSEVTPLFPRWVPLGCGIAAAVFLLVGFAGGAIVMHTGVGKFMAILLDMSSSQLTPLMGKDVTPAEKQALNQELSQLSRNVESNKTSVARLEPVLTVMKESMDDKKISPQEVGKIIKAAHEANGPPPNGAPASAGKRGPAKAGAPLPKK